MHGHKIRRRTELMNVEAWGEVSVGSVYGTIRRLAQEGLIRAERTEREGRFPARTVYAITPAGQQEYRQLLDHGLREIKLKADPFDIALAVASGIDENKMRTILDERRQALTTLGEQLAAQHRQLTADGVLTVVGQAIFRHWEVRVEGELRWLGELADITIESDPVRPTEDRQT